MSRGSGVRLPGCAVSDHRVEHRQELPHAGNKGDLARLALIAKPVVERADRFVASDARDDTHVQRGPNLSSASPHRSSSCPEATVTVEWRYASQRSDLAAIQRPELW
jgi:hypothetical protein